MRYTRPMRPSQLLVLLSLFGASALAAPSAQPPKTFRLDFFHTGSATEERFSVDRLVIEPLAFPGDPGQPLDRTNAGKYFFEVQALDSKRPLYSRGFSSIYGEWETTAEAKSVHRTFHESLRFPLPAAKVQVVVRKRDAQNVFKDIWTTVVDPQDMFVDPSRPPSPGPLTELQKKGDPATKVDLLILGDGYTAAERPKFEKDARRLMEVLFTYAPFKERREQFNVWGLCPPSEESGVSRPSTGVHHYTRVGASYDAFGSERYILTFDNRAFREVASFAPYDYVEILANGNTYGGGGIYNLYSTVASDSLFSPYVFVHELGHHIAGLADEYFTSESAYESTSSRLEPWEPNVTALADPKALKWGKRAAPGIPLPTPWNQKEWELREGEIQKRRKQIRAAKRPESEMDALFTEEKALATQMLGSEKFSGKVGAFEGANYESKGFYRPQTDCVMFTRDAVPFCGVCQNALGRMLDLYAPAGSSKK